MTVRKDPQYRTPYVDVDEWRDDPVRHRYVHGGFEGTDLRFSCYFPPPEQYEGRFFQPLSAVSGNENMFGTGLMGLMGGGVAFAIDSGGYLVESNLGLPTPFPADDPTVAGFRASAATAEYSRVLASEMYGEHRPYGYCYGGSGGGYKAISCLESTVGVWDGGVPFIHGNDNTLINVFGVQAHAMRILRGKFDRIVDAVDSGGSGDMYAGLTAEEREALAEATALGFPPRSWFAVERMGAGAWPVLADHMLEWDPGYFEDFWTVPGYLGYDPPRSLQEARVQHKTTVVEPIMADQAASLGIPAVMGIFRSGAAEDLPIALRVKEPPEGNLLGAMLRVTSGKGAGHNFWISAVMGDVLVTTAGGAHFGSLSGIVAGDEVVVDNSVYLAAQTYHRHQVHPDFPEWDYFCIDGRPLYPQRPLIGPKYARNGAGSTQSGRFDSKMIVVQTLMDEFAHPNLALYYRKLVERALGDRMDDQYRLWFVDHAMHMPPMMPGDATRIVSFAPVIEQALRDVANWAERGLAPPSSTAYRFSQGQVHVPARASERLGIQPTVDVTANGGQRAEVAVGEEVGFQGDVEMPPGAGTIVGAEWDFEGAGDYAAKVTDFFGSETRRTITATHSFDKPGTYFPALRVYSHRQGDVHTPHCRVQNLGRVRVVVS